MIVWMAEVVTMFCTVAPVRDMMIGGLGSDTYYIGMRNDLFGTGAMGVDYITDSGGEMDTVVFANASTLNWQTGQLLGDCAFAQFIDNGSLERLVGSAGNDTIIVRNDSAYAWVLDGRAEATFLVAEPLMTK